MENFEEESMVYLAGGLSATEESAFEEFLRENQDYQSRFEEVKSSWALLSALDSPEPSEAMDDAFIKMLDTAERKQAKKREPSLWHTWRQIFTPSLAFGTLLLLVGLGVGYWFSPKENSIPQNNAVVVEGETEAVRQKLVLTLLEQPSANQRLDGVNEANKIKEVDDMVISALLQTLNNDPNVNVRLAAIESLANYVDKPIVRQGLVQSIAQQESPLVQVTLANLMVALQEKSSIEPFKQLLKEKQLDTTVKKQIQKSINSII
ncbi:MAG: HEAT repeat domain-containing protein [Bacteroidota bacterium]